MFDIADERFDSLEDIRIDLAKLTSLYLNSRDGMRSRVSGFVLLVYSLCATSTSRMVL